MAPSKRFSNTYSYSYITKLATSVTHLCPEVFQIEFLPAALSNSEVPHCGLVQSSINKG